MRYPEETFVKWLGAPRRRMMDEDAPGVSSLPGNSEKRRRPYAESNKTNWRAVQFRSGRGIKDLDKSAFDER